MSVFLSFCIRETPGEITFSSVKINSSSVPVSMFLTKTFDKAFEISDLIIHFFKKVNPPIRVPSLAGTKSFHSFILYC